MITLTGLTPRQRKWVEILRLTEDSRELERFCSLDLDARIVRDLIIAADLDQGVVSSSMEEARTILSQFTL